MSKRNACAGVDFRLVLLVCTSFLLGALAPVGGAEARSPNPVPDSQAATYGWKLTEVRVDPDKADQPQPVPNMYEGRQQGWTQLRRSKDFVSYTSRTTHADGRVANDADLTATFDAPPDVIRPGDSFDLRIVLNAVLRATYNPEDMWGSWECHQIQCKMIQRDPPVAGAEQPYPHVGGTIGQNPVLSASSITRFTMLVKDDRGDVYKPETVEILSRGPGLQGYPIVTHYIYKLTEGITSGGTSTTQPGTTTSSQSGGGYACKLSEVQVDPSMKDEPQPVPNMYEGRQQGWTQMRRQKDFVSWTSKITNADGSPYTDAEASAKFDPPPEVIRPGDSFDLRILLNAVLNNTSGGGIDWWGSLHCAQMQCKMIQRDPPVAGAEQPYPHVGGTIGQNPVLSASSITRYTLPAKTERGEDYKPELLEIWSLGPVRTGYGIVTKYNYKCGEGVAPSSGTSTNQPGTSSGTNTSGTGTNQPGSGTGTNPGTSGTGTNQPGSSTGTNQPGSSSGTSQSGSSTGTNQPGTSTGTSQTGTGTSSSSSVPGATLPKPPFTASEPANSSKMAIQAAQRQVLPDNLVVLPVYLINAENVANINFDLTYDAKVVKPEGTIAKGSLLDNAMLSVNPNNPGTIRIGFSQSSGLSGTGTVVYIPFRAVGKAGDRTDLTPVVTTINNPSGTIPAIDRILGEITIVGPGGSNSPGGTSGPGGIGKGNCTGHPGALDVSDAWCALEMSTGKRPVNLVMDMDSSNDVTSRDSTLVLQDIARRVGQ